MRIEQKFVDIAIKYTEKEAKNQSIIFNDKDIQEFRKTLNDMAGTRNYKEGQNIDQTDIAVIAAGMDKVFDGVAQNFAKMSDDFKKRINLNQYSTIAYSHLISLIMKDLNSPEIPPYTFMKNVSQLSKNIAKERPTQAVSLDDTYKQQRRMNAEEMNKLRDVDSLINNVQKNMYSPDDLNKLYAEYRALSKRQADHGPIWRFFHRSENEARTNMLKDMENALKTRIPEEMLNSNASSEEIKKYGEWQKSSQNLPQWISVYDENPASRYGYYEYQNNPELLEKMNLETEKKQEKTLNEQLADDLKDKNVEKTEKYPSDPAITSPTMSIS